MASQIDAERKRDYGIGRRVKLLGGGRWWGSAALRGAPLRGGVGAQAAIVDRPRALDGEQKARVVALRLGTRRDLLRNCEGCHGGADNVQSAFMWSSSTASCGGIRNRMWEHAAEQRKGLLEDHMTKGVLRRGWRESIWGVPGLIRNKPEGWRTEVAKTLGLWAAIIAFAALVYATGHSLDWGALRF